MNKTKSFENKWGDKIEFYEDYLEFLIEDEWKFTNNLDKVPSQKAGIFKHPYIKLPKISFSFSETSYSFWFGRKFGYLKLGEEKIYFDSDNDYWIQAKHLIEKSTTKGHKLKAWEREQARDYSAAIEIWETLGEIEEAARVRKMKSEQGSVKVAQKVVQGDQVTKTEIKDSVLNRSNVGGGSSKIKELEKLAEMKDKGIIDDEEFKQMKKEILGK